MPSKMPLVFVFCALPCEARSLIRAWKLTKQLDCQPFAVYANSERVVTVSGIGKVAMAGAVAYVMARFLSDPMPILLNIGIAGHRSGAQGALCLADKVADADSGRCFYPQLPFSPPCRTGELITYVRPNRDYAVDALYDMEASAFYEIAVKFSSAELIHCLKIVSDNADFSVDTVNEATVEAWCGLGMEVIENLISRLRELKRAIPVDALTLSDEIEQVFHFSATNASRLRGLLRRWRLAYGGEQLHWREAGCRNGKELLLWLEANLNDQRFYL